MLCISTRIYVASSQIIINCIIGDDVTRKKSCTMMQAGRRSMWA